CPLLPFGRDEISVRSFLRIRPGRQRIPQGSLMDVSIPSSPGPGRPPVAYEFGPFRLEPAEQRLTHGGRVVPLPHRAFEVLVFLVERSGRLVTKEELLEGLWSGLFVEEGNISQNVFLLRRALTGGPAGPDYIETVPRSGYRFVGPVTEILEGP